MSKTTNNRSSTIAASELADVLKAMQVRTGLKAGKKIISCI